MPFTVTTSIKSYIKHQAYSKLNKCKSLSLLLAIPEVKGSTLSLDSVFLTLNSYIFFCLKKFS